MCSYVFMIYIVVYKVVYIVVHIPVYIGVSIGVYKVVYRVVYTRLISNYFPGEPAHPTGIRTCPSLVCPHPMMI